MKSAEPDFGKERVFDRPGCRLRYWLKGSDGDLPLILFMHGAGFDHRTWGGQVAAFAGRYRMLTLDIRGHGRSRPADDYDFASLVDDSLALLDAIGAGRAILVGLSMGGNIAQEMVFRHPDRFAALVCADCTCNTLTPWWDRAMLPVYQALIGPAIQAWPRRKLLAEIAMRTSLSPEGRRYVADAMGQLTNAEIAQVMKSLLAAVRHDPGYRVTIPELLVHGAHDTLGNIRQVMPAWHGRDPNSELAVIPEAGHAVNMDNSAAFNRTVLDWLQRVIG